ncbi:hypothetical protein AWU65_14425 [Paenibacillus glucanolyticus]|uniref:Carrier domain-containing protein n=1 Tax=Paenibacillus glucanolyticus TaxID=59843 RepID=A0A163K720_9BACL|nr:non-ribosomal peptide synthetase [Paenibacillus glucanolyticus]KZS47034.1 hypothetical protein AWU65_14425 [Paenibacillus glucanolyticus]
MFKPNEVKDIYGLSPMQMGMLYHYIDESDSNIYLGQSIFKVIGAVDQNILHNSFNFLVEKYDVLRTVFVYEKVRKPVQVILKEKNVELNFLDISHIQKRDEVEDSINQFVEKDRQKRFNLNKDIMIRLSLLKIGEEEYLLILTSHHILMDGWCMGVVMDELLNNYHNIVYRKPLIKEKVPPYRLYIDWIQQQDADEGLAYWKHYLGGYSFAPQITNFISKDRSSRERFTTSYSLSKPLTENMKKMAISHNVTLSVLFQSIWGVLLQKYNNTDDVVYGSVVSGRPSEIEGVEDIVGLFVNTIPTRINSKNAESFSDLLSSSQSKFLESLNYQYLSLADIQSTLRNENKNIPIIDHIIVFENYPIDIERSVAEREGLFEINLIDGFEQSDYPFVLEVIEKEELLIDLHYDPELYSTEWIVNLLNNFEHLACKLIDSPYDSFSNFDFITTEEKRKIITEFNDTSTPYTSQTIHEMFEKQVANTPDHIAVVYEEQQLTYKEINARANQLARVIRSKGVVTDKFVGVMMKRSSEFIIGMLAVLKAGGAYVPLDPDYPAQRLSYMLADSGTRLLLTHSDLTIPENYAGEILEIDRMSFDGEDVSNLDVVNGSHDLAYLIYTSGSTGNPKGVMVDHDGVCNLSEIASKLQIDPHSRVLQVASMSFDASVWEIFLGLFHGATLYIVPKMIQHSGEQFAQWLDNHRITCIPFISPSLLRTLPSVQLPDLKTIVTAGEVLPVDLVEVWSHERIFINAYGPTETTVCATLAQCVSGMAKAPIGTPISNKKVYILNPALQVMPIGVPGELCVGGVGIARGYWQRPELTAEKFIDNPFEPGERLYRTGDLVRWLPDGSIEYVGRIDEQVKIRGNRVELGEIEAALLEHPKVKETVVITRQEEQDSAYLCAYLVTSASWSVGELRQHVGSTLPEYMIPSYFVEMEQLPLTPNGKVDKKGLPKPEGQLQMSAPYEAPATPTEEILVQIWQEVLGSERIGVLDNFFELGGHSLKAMMLVSRMHKGLDVEIPLREVFARKNIRELTEYIKQHGNERVYEDIAVAEEQPYYITSSAQRRMYVVQQLEGADTSYNMPVVYHVQGPLDEERWKQAVHALIERHEALRTSFELIDDALMQIIHPRVRINMDILDVGAEEAEQHIQQFVRLFDLSQAPLFRIQLLRLGAEEYLLLMDMHHIISDGMSWDILLRELGALYEGQTLEPLRIQYKDYAVWQQSREQKERLVRHKQYWLDQYEGELPVLELPTDYPRPPVQRFEGETYEFELDAQMLHGLKALAVQEGSTLYAVLLACYNILLAKYTGQEDIIVGTAIVGRPQMELEKIVGVFINTITFRNAPQAALSFRTFLTQVKDQVYASYEHAEYPFEELIEQLQLRRDMSRHPLVDTLFTLQNSQANARMNLKNLEITPRATEWNNTQFDLSWDAFNNGENLQILVEYSTHLFQRASIERMAEHFKHIVAQVVANPKMRISEVEVTTVAEQWQILYDFNQTTKDYAHDKTIQELFEAQVKRTPNYIAVVFEDEQLTYREVNARANHLARVLRNKGVARDEYVGVMMERSMDMVVAILGVLKAGGAYVPLDPDYPVQRLSYMLADSGTQLLLTHHSLSIPESYTGETLEVDRIPLNGEDVSNLDIVNGPHDLAYLIYTSGSTGNPKGVMVEHQGVCNLSLMAETYNIHEGSHVLQFGSFSFDAAVGDVFHSLLHGATIYIPPKELILSSDQFIDWLDDNQISTIPFIPPSFLTGLPYRRLENLTSISTGGESLPIELVRKWGEGRRFLNAYGPTEATVDTTIALCTPDMAKAPIGTPISNKKVYILNPALQVMPIGVPGELCVGGVGIARGYWQRPELTAEKFIDNPFEPGERLYRTGDLVRWLPDGSIEYVGRIDEQVKIRGNRVELGEIEAALLEHPKVKEAVVIARQEEQDSAYLCAYLVTSASWSVGELRQHVGSTLPEYMIPSYFVEMEQLPLTPNGKVDKKGLPKPEGQLQTSAPYEGPATPTEEILVQIWQEVLGSERIGVLDNFFELGGDSIKAIQIAARLSKYHLKLEMKDLFRHPSISGVADKVKNELCSFDQGTVTGQVPLTPIQQWFFKEQFVKPDHWNQSVILPHQHWDIDRVVKAFQILVNHHDALRMIYSQQEQGIVQMNRGIEGELFAVEEHDFCQESDTDWRMKKQWDRMQGSLSLEEGKLIRLGVIHTTKEDYLCIIIHHLVIDGVSWRILLEDFHTLYENGCAQLPIKTSSYQAWANELQNYAQSKKLKQEIAYWQHIETNRGHELPKDNNGPNVYPMEDGETKTLTLEQEQTRELLTVVHRAYQTEINDLLLTALVLAIKTWTQGSKVLVSMEGHGREEVIAGVDVNRTVGWFTTVYPVLFEVQKSDIETVIQTVKETLRRVPAKGIGYGIIKYLSDDHLWETEPEISFNYLGQFDEPSNENLGGMEIAPENHSQHILDINGLVEEGKLKLSFTYNSYVFRSSTMQSLVDNYKAYLKAIIAHCKEKKETQRTPSDFGMKELSIEDLEEAFTFLENRS